MKTKYSLLLLVLVLVGLSSCKKYLDITPKGYVIPSKIQDFERLLNDGSNFRFLATDIDFLSDDYYFRSLDRTNFAETSQTRLYFWQPDAYLTREEIKYSFWAALYSNIYQFNAILNGIDKAEGATPARVASAKAQAKFGRALSYWYLVNLYSKPYNKQTASTDPGVPLVTANEVTKNLPGRGSVQGTYDFILKDLTEALNDVPIAAANAYLISKPAVYGYLARTYLMLGDYVKAGEAADKALSFNSRLIDYNTVYSNKTASNGVAYIGIKTGVTTFSDRLTVPENIFAQLYTYTGGMFNQPIAKTTEQLFDAKDLRRVFLIPYVEANITWDGIYTYMDQFIYVNPGISVPEMYLVRAEAYARGNNLTAAMADLNTLRKTRYRPADYTDLSASDQKDAIRKVLLERRKELLFKGARWFDMRRLNNDPDFGFTARHYFTNGTFIELQPNSPSYTLHLPESALSTDIQQNK
ncbi:tetratricopeptide (TPR) repeat protein [Pedobacter africanus]|uniref:Tetratricopeptide (TPR) repeat protein n=1 Tax=Pedobacter africanus TaxID=151894 RepID=A0ACC6L4D1_9SPHI|nr:RagB/SusD family nutrient uptake outer membrane protein [Pedobacter africanus]MDR6786508.1 tetratricopeptide (TPR) repeat protein [Pedobacter africanus]